MAINVITIEGTLGKDPELKYVGANNTELAEFSIAVNEEGKNGAKTTFWVNVKAWKYGALVVADNFKKGSQVVVHGKLAIESWKNKAGTNSYKTTIIAYSVTPKVYVKKGANDATPANDPAYPDMEPSEDTPF